MIIRAIAGKLRIPPGAEVAGIAIGENGQALHLGAIVSGAVGQLVNNQATLRMEARPWNMRGNIALAHVEGHVAALMREQNGPRHVSLVITRDPCDGPYGCDERLPDMLPAGSTLTLYVREGGGLRFFKKYIGNGRVVLPRGDV
ncbi:DddA-like double-stranded DNA deaminase toxin [Actinoplanes sp. NPDC051346]|uniref:DddA-like double-stranded DNA deaminase toxin n=1 Tax=Actinoplanes sp. NPDC051346 TaxID=3155048 RepID=UPI00342DA0C1